MNTQAREAGKTAPKRILIAEDDETLRGVVVEMFAKKGIQVATAGNGAQALASLMEGRFDAAVLDVVMPGMGGLTVLEELKRSGNRTPVVLTSGHVGLLEGRRFREMGAAAVLGKPFRLEELAEAVLGCAAGESGNKTPAASHDKSDA